MLISRGYSRHAWHAAHVPGGHRPLERGSRGIKRETLYSIGKIKDNLRTQATRNEKARVCVGMMCTFKVLVDCRVISFGWKN